MCNEITSHEQILNSIYQSGEKLITDGHPSSDDIQNKIASMKEKSVQLNEHCNDRSALLDKYHKAYQVCYDYIY